MTLQECYAALGGNYDDVLARLRTERLVQKFVIKFLDDHSFETLVRSLETGETEEAFRAAHTIKGMCQNLSFDRLSASSAQITELLRGEADLEAARALLPRVQEDYQCTAEAIRAFAAAL